MIGLVGQFLWANRAAVLLVLLLGLVWKWHSDQIENAVDATKTELKASADTKAREDLIAAQGTWIANTSLLTTLAAVDDAAMFQRLAAIDVNVRALKSEYSHHADATPLSADCFADPGRVQRVNTARGR